MSNYVESKSATFGQPFEQLVKEKEREDKKICLLYGLAIPLSRLIDDVRNYLFDVYLEDLERMATDFNYPLLKLLESHRKEIFDKIEKSKRTMVEK